MVVGTRWGDVVGTKAVVVTGGTTGEVGIDEEVWGTSAVVLVLMVLLLVIVLVLELVLILV